MTNESKDIKFVGISVKDGQAPAIKFEVFDCINDKTLELSIPRTELLPRNVENLIARNCIFRKNRALAPHERSAVPLGTDHCPVG